MKQIYYLFGVIAVLVAIGTWVFLSQPRTPKINSVTVVNEISSTTTPIIPQENPPVATSSSMITPDTKGRVVAKIGDTIILPGSSFKILGVTQDSRCPAGVACIWAGEVQLALLATEGNDHANIIIKSNAPAITIGKSNVTLVEVGPLKTQEVIVDKSYRFIFQVQRTPTTPVTAGIRGRVLIGPMCPVVREGVDCPDRPGEGIVLGVYDKKGRVAEATTDKNGNTGTIVLPVGVYTVRQADGKVHPRIPETEVSVVKDQITEFTIHGDSGIR